MIKRFRKALNRSGHASCELCKEPNILVEHHIRGRKITDPNHPSNLMYVCSNCHNYIHHGVIVIENKHLTSNGYTIIWHHRDSESITGDDAKTYTY